MSPTQKRKADEAKEAGRGNNEGDSKQLVSSSEDEEQIDGLKNEHKRQKTAIDAIVEECSCPLSLELPVEPVTAEDGRVYNRADITKHIENARNDNLRSPLTNEKMGPKLVPAVQVQNMIRALVENGTVNDANIGQWKKVDVTRSKAMNGDPEAMYNLGRCYYNGINGLVKNREIAYSWSKKAADLGYDRAKAKVGFMQYKGLGVKQNTAEGALHLGVAAAMGSPHAAHNLAFFNFFGDRDTSGFAKDNVKARYWLNKALGNFGDHVRRQKKAEDLKTLLDIEEDNDGD